MDRLKEITEFREFPKIHRWERDIVVTEKIDGTNAHAAVVQFTDQDIADMGPSGPAVDQFATIEGMVRTGDVARVELTLGNGSKVLRFLRAGSRNRWLKPDGKTDNFGFARWVFDNANQLAQLGPGKHYGEWWGYGIQRGYGLREGERKFSLFNVNRFHADSVPACCSVVPVLHRGPLKMPSGELATDFCLRRLEYAGSEAARGFRNFEGIVVYHTAGNVLFKRTTGPEETRGKEHAA